MHNIPFQVFAWIASFAYGLEVVATKLLAKHEIKNPWLVNFTFSGVVLVLTIPFAVHFGAGFPEHWGNTIWVGVFWAVSNILYILALYKLDLTTLSPLFNLRSMLGIIFGFLFLSETITLAQFILIGFMFVGGILVTLDERMSLRSSLDWGVVLAFFSMISFTIWAVFIKKAIAEMDFWTATLWMLIISQILFCFTVPWFIKELKNVTKKQGFFIFILGVFDLIGVLAANRAYGENVIISSAIINLPLSAAMAFIISMIFPNSLEKHTGGVYLFRFIGIALIVWAATQLK